MRYDISYKMREYDIHNDRSIPRLVSFPRTGSHWFRYIMEVATGTPAMVSSYYYPNPEKCWGLHMHDRWLDNSDVPPTSNLEKVIYLFRDGVDTVYSQLRYDKTILAENDWEPNEFIDQQVDAVTSQYESHLKRWRFNRDDIVECLEIRYEQMAGETKKTFEKVFEFLSLDIPEERLIYAIGDATKEKIDSLITDHHAMDKLSAYNPKKHAESKNRFKEVYGKQVNERLRELLR
jgi:hypothetical protein